MTITKEQIKEWQSDFRQRAWPLDIAPSEFEYIAQRAAAHGAAQAKVPLTDEFILNDVLALGTAEFTTICGPTEILKFARAIEAAHGAAQANVPLTKEDVRKAGGIVHSDGNIFFTNLEQLNAAHGIKEQA